MGDHGTARLPTGGVGSSTVAAAGVAAVKWTSRIPTPAAANVDTTVTDSTRKRVAGTDTCTAPSIVAATPDPPQPARLNTVLGEKQDAFYTHKDGRREAVEVRERYNESQGGGYCIYISSLGRERDIPSEKLETNPNEMAAANEVTAVLGEKMAVSVGQEGGSSEPPSASPSSYVSSTVAAAGAAASVRFSGYISQGGQEGGRNSSSSSSTRLRYDYGRTFRNAVTIINILALKGRLLSLGSLVFV